MFLLVFVCYVVLLRGIFFVFIEVSMWVYFVFGGLNLFCKYEGLELFKYCFLEIFLYVEVGCRIFFFDWERKRIILS